MVRKAILIGSDYKGELLEVEVACRKNLSRQPDVA